jgi:tRNA threonylcarbamoyl adenosine modification protein YeaZ
MTRADSQQSILMIDSSSPLLSVAVGSPEETVLELQSESSRSSTALMGLIDDCLSGAQVELRQLGGVVVLSGPGSFTGLRVGMSIALGFHQALGLAAGTLSTFTALAHRAPHPDQPTLALVRALRGEWFGQRFLPGLTIDGEPFRIRDEELMARSEQLVGFDLGSDLGGDLGSEGPGPLSGAALALPRHIDWDPLSLTRPAYLAPPPTHRKGPARAAG